MKEIFADLYNKVVDFFTKTEEKEESKNVARNRLKLVLMQDRTNLNPRLLERLRGEMIDLLSKYVVMDKELLELNFTPEDDQLALMLSIPVVRAKDEDEIEEAIKAEEAEKERIAKLVEKAEELDEDSDEDDEDEEEVEFEEEIEVEVEANDDNDDEDTSNEDEKEKSSEEKSEESEKTKKKKKKKNKKKKQQETSESQEQQEKVEEEVKEEEKSEESETPEDTEKTDDEKEVKEETSEE